MQSLVRFIAVLLLMGGAACVRTASDPTPGNTNAPKTELLAGTVLKSWNLVDTKVDGLGAWGQTRPCAKDDFLTFKNDKSYEWNDGTLRCSEKIPQVYEKGAWELGTGETEIILNKKDRYKIVSLTSTKLQLSIKNIFGETEEYFFEAQSL